MKNKFIENIVMEWSEEPDPRRLWDALHSLKANPLDALSMFEDLAEGGSRLSLVYMGDAYLYGRGVKENKGKGERLLRRASSLGSIEAVYTLARYYEGLKEFDRARIEFCKIANRGYSPALYMLGSFYYYGEGVKKDIDKAIYYWNLAESAGHLIAKQWIVWLYKHYKKGITFRIRAYAKQISLTFPLVVTKVRNPNSDRLRNW